MTQKQMQERIEALEKELSELKSQMLALALRPATTYPVFVPQPTPYFKPQIVPRWTPEPMWPVIQ
jgi:hypothetical protein